MFFALGQVGPCASNANKGPAAGCISSRTGAASDQQWHHVAYACDGLGVSLFIDGKRSSNRLPLALKGNEKINLFLGPSRFADPNRNQFRGEICAFRLSSTKRYTNDFEPPATFEKDDQTITLLDFSRGQGTTIEDLSGQGHHGTISGATWERM